MSMRNNNFFARLLASLSIIGAVALSIESSALSIIGGKNSTQMLGIKNSIASHIDQALPHWDTAILEATSFDNPIEQLTIDKITDAISGEPFSTTQKQEEENKTSAHNKHVVLEPRKIS